MNNLQLFADGIKPDKQYMDTIMDSYGIVGYTCNPTLVKQFVPMSYKDYCTSIIKNSRNYSVSIQTLSSNLEEIYQQAKTISLWGNNVYVKIPVITENKQDTSEIIIKLLEEGIKINVTSIFTPEQVERLIKTGLNKTHDCILSIFCGRIADTGLVPNDVISKINDKLQERGNIKLLWAGSRSSLDIHFAAQYCDIITLPQSIIDKLKLKSKSLEEYTLETVKMFANDSKIFTLD